MKRPLAYITAAWGADEIENTEDAARYCRKVYDANFRNAHYILELLRFIRHRNWKRFFRFLLDLELTPSDKLVYRIKRDKENVT